jgi:hypothetical protein
LDDALKQIDLTKRVVLGCVIASCKRRQKGHLPCQSVTRHGIVARLRN